MKIRALALNRAGILAAVAMAVSAGPALGQTASVDFKLNAPVNRISMEHTHRFAKWFIAGRTVSSSDVSAAQAEISAAADARASATAPADRSAADTRVSRSQALLERAKLRSQLTGTYSPRALRRLNFTRNASAQAAATDARAPATARPLERQPGLTDLEFMSELDYATMSNPLPALDLGQLQLLRTQLNAGGLGASVLAAMLYEPDGIKNNPNNPGNPRFELHWNLLTLSVLPDNSATFHIVTRKFFRRPGPDCEGDQALEKPECQLNATVFRWEIFVRPGGLKYDYIPEPLRAGLHHKYFASGADIEIRAFDINGEPVSAYNQRTGAINPMAVVWTPAPSDCIDINSKVLLGNGSIIAPTVKDLNFCAGSCSGYLLAATNT